MPRRINALRLWQILMLGVYVSGLFQIGMCAMQTAFCPDMPRRCSMLMLLAV